MSTPTHPESGEPDGGERGDVTDPTDDVTSAEATDAEDVTGSDEASDAVEDSADEASDAVEDSADEASEQDDSADEASEDRTEKATAASTTRSATRSAAASRSKSRKPSSEKVVATAGKGRATRTRAEAEREVRPHIFARIALFVRQVIAELKKVVTPTRSELLTYIAVVVVFVLIIMAYVGVLDFGIGKLVLWAFGS